MKLKLVRLIPADNGAKEIIDRLNDDGIYWQKEGENVLMTAVLATTEKGVNDIHLLLKQQKANHKVVLIQATDELMNICDNVFDSIISFTPSANVYENMKLFLWLFYNTIEIRGVSSFDFYDFFSLIRGRNRISLQKKSYISDIEEALCHLKYDRRHSQNRYLLAICMDTTEKEFMKSLGEIGEHKFFRETFTDDTLLNVVVVNSPLRQVILCTVI